MRFIKNTIYQLKRDYGFTIIAYRIVSKEIDVETGEQKVVLQDKEIKRVLLLPNSLTRKEGKAGGYYDPNKRVILIEYQPDFKINIGDYVIYNRQKFNIIEISEFEYQKAYILTLQSDTRAPIANIFTRAVTDDFIISQEIS